MKFERLRLAGFKSFCDPTEFKIEPGLTGVVGPNGCGKSNLVEAMRWVMGESSYKSMRAAGMDEVIFAGSGKRPSRNIAEVGLVLDNSARRAPAAFNEHDVIEVTRRIERESGSTYRVNGREARARDVQMLFADAATGARSPSMVRQGQIGEIIAAKPQARRLILEEAAGVSGLHSRRHEAELRLKGAEDNLVRLEDVIKQIDAQIDSLRKQARQATRYRNLAADIRRHEALTKWIAWREVEQGYAEAERRLEADVREVAERTRVQAEAARSQAIAAAALPALRDAEARAGAALHRLTLARDALASEEKRAEERTAELKRRIEQLAHDLKREEALIVDAAEVEARLEAEDVSLADEVEGADAAREEAEARRSDAERALGIAESALGEAQAALSDVNARRNALAAAVAEEARRLTRFEAELAGLEREQAAAGGLDAEAEAFEAAEATLETLNAALEDAEADALEAEARQTRAREKEAAARTPLAEAERAAERLETEAQTLKNLLGSAAGGAWPPVVDALTVERGFEAAIGAALGDDLEASTAPGAPALWAKPAGPYEDPALPAGIESSRRTHVEAPIELQRRLRQIGVVAREQGEALRGELKAGQRLVSRNGDLWRWDGFVAAAEAPTPAARRLAEKNRLGDLEAEAESARERAEAAREVAERAEEELRQAANAEGSARLRARAALLERDTGREKLVAAERRRAQALAKASALVDATARAKTARDEALERRLAAEAALAGLESDDLALALERARAAAARGARRTRRGARPRTDAEPRARSPQRAPPARRRRAPLVARAARAGRSADRGV